MSRESDETSDESTSRRAALRSIGAGAAIVGFGPAVSAAKSAANASLESSGPGDCYYEYKCSGEVCQYGGYNYYRRQCCDYGEVTCDDNWEWYGCC